MSHDWSVVRRVLPLCLFLVLMGLAKPAAAQGFSDGFENGAIDPFWSTFQQLGTAQLSSEQSHSGAQSIKLSSSLVGQRTVLLTHTFSQATKGTLSVWFFDNSPGTATLYSGLYAYNTVTSDSFAVNVADWNGTHYVWHGPGSGEAPTGVPRTAGWHELTLRVTDTGFEALVDQVVVGAIAGDFTFDTVHLLLQGPGSRAATFYFDDFSFTPPGPTHAVCLLYDTSKAHKQGSTIPIRLQVCDQQGANLSSPSIVVTAIDIVRISDDSSGMPEDSGNANPDLDFRYSEDLEGYIFNLSTKNLTQGSYVLRLTVDGNPILYLAPFKVR